jgi:hypothetical protein
VRHRLVPPPSSLPRNVRPAQSPGRAAFRARFDVWRADLNGVAQDRFLNGNISCKKFKPGTKFRFDFASRLRTRKAGINVENLLKRSGLAVNDIKNDSIRLSIQKQIKFIGLARQIAHLRRKLRCSETVASLRRLRSISAPSSGTILKIEPAPFHLRTLGQARTNVRTNSKFSSETLWYAI